MTNRFMIRLLQATIVVAAVLLIGVKALTFVRAQGPTGLLPSPDAWVPFAADVSRTTPKAPPVEGRFFRAADGSTRLETGPTQSDIQSIDIKNIGLERWYGFLKGPGWVEHPMKLRFKPQPPRVLANAVANVPRSRFERFDSLQRTFPDGRIEVSIPQLNFFVVDQIVPNGTRTRFYNIQLGVALDPTLFTPPVGVAVRFNPEPAGIIMHGPEDTEIDPTTGRVRFKDHH